MTSQIEDLHEAAVAAAKAASNNMYVYDYGSKDQYPCGFAWVELYDVRLNSTVGKLFKKIGFDRDYSSGPISLWNPSGWAGQNVSIKLAGAIAYAKVFTEAGFRVTARSRLD